MKLLKMIAGGFASSYRTYIIFGAGIISALATWIIGDIDLFEMTNTIFTLAGIFFLRNSMTQTKGKENADS